MISRQSREHCSEPRLRLFLDDRLDEDEARLLTSHLDQCEACRQTLERLASGSRIFAELRDGSPLAGSRGMFGVGATESISSHHGDTPSVDALIMLDFLGPPTKAGMIGRLGPYEVTEVLGQGGFGIVLKAFDPALSRSVAIKVLAPRLATSAAARNRFAREARAAAAVVHDNVIAIHSVDSWNGLPYLVMPCIAGRSLQERVDDDGPLGVKEVLRVGMQAAQALAAAHDQGLVHRDIKPSNILLENGVERVKLSDFGLARAVDDASQTQSGVVAGTPQYMSPEQARGEAIDHRSDLFSLGGVLYFMCTGHSPFRADSTPAVLRRVCDEQPRPLRQVNPDVPAWLAKIIDRLLEKDPGKRFGSAAEVAELLKRHLADLQRTGSSSPLPSISLGGIGRRKAALMAAAPAALVLLAFAARPGRQAEVPRETNAIVPVVQKTDNVHPGQTTFNVSNGNSSDPVIVGTGKAVEKTWEIADFSKVVVGSTFQAVITRGDRFKVTTTSDEALVDFLEVGTMDGALTLRLKPGHNYRFNEPLRAEVTMPSLAGVSVRDSSKTTVKGFQVEQDFTLLVKDASTLDGTIDLNRAEFEIADASQVKLSGSAKFARVRGRDASRLDLSEFPIDECQIRLSDASKAQIVVRSDRKFEAMISDSSDLSGVVNASTILMEITDASKVRFQGKALSAALVARGAGKLDFAQLNLADAKVELGESSQAVLNVQKRLEYQISEGSTLEYLGQPESVHGKKSKSATLRSR